MYPQLTEPQKINYFHLLLRGDALQVFCNIEDSKKDSLNDIMAILKRRFGDYLSMAKARSEWDSLKFDSATQKLHEFLDVLQKTAKEVFGSEIQQFIDKTIYAKMPDHVKKILNRAYLEDKPYNDIVLHLEREMRLDGLGAPDEVTLVPLKKIEPAQTKPDTKQVENTTQNTKKGYCFYCNKFGHYKAECRNLKRDKWQQTRKNNGQANYSAGKPPKCDTCGKPHKTEDCWNGANAANDPRPKRHNTQERKTDTSVQQTTTKPADEQKTNYAAPAIWGNSRREGVFTRRPPYHIHNRHNSRMHWYSDGSLAETTSNRLHEKTAPRKRTGSNIPTRSGLQTRL